MQKVGNLLQELIPSPGAVQNKTSVTTVVTMLSLATGGVLQSNTKTVNITIEGANVRIRADGTNPTTSTGIIYYAGGTYQFSAQYILAASIVAAAGTAVINFEELAYSFQ